jgi:hypothetical protein
MPRNFVPAYASAFAPTRTLAMALVLPVALSLTASPAEAQFGKLKKIGGEIAKEAGREAAGLPPKKTESAAASASTSSPKADYSITPERVDLMLAALAPLAENARKESAAKEVEVSFRAKRDKWEKCVSDAAKTATKMSDAYLNGAGDITGKQAAAMGRLATAMQAPNRKREVAFLQDTVGVMSIELSILMTGAKCGPSVYTPAALIDAQLVRDAGGVGEVDESGRRVGAFEVPERARKELTARQFGLIRERMAVYAIALAKGDGSEGSLGGFNDAERGALGARASDLKALAPFFRDGSLRWATWGDVKSW